MLSTEEQIKLQDGVVKILEFGPLPSSKIALKLLDAELGEVEDAKDFDKLLQNLRKRGVLYFASNKWHLTSRKPCANCNGTGYLVEKMESA
jgi:hypothetical protein